LFGDVSSSKTGKTAKKPVLTENGSYSLSLYININQAT
jgi:hypothetical protein